MGLKRLFIIFLLLIGCSPDIQIQRIVFGRECISVELSQKVFVRKIAIYKDQKRIALKKIGQKVRQIIFDFNWQPEQRYLIKLSLKNKSLSLNCKAPLKASPVVWASFELEDVEARSLYDYGYLGGQVVISGDSRYLAVGTEKTYLRVFDILKRKLMWKKRIGEGRILEIVFSRDGNYLIVGEQSQDAYVYCFKSDKGKLLWKYRTANDVGEKEKGEPQHRWPVVTGIAIGKSRAFCSAAKCYVAAKRQFVKKGDYYYTAKIYCFDIPTGKILWTYPKKGCMDASPSMLVIDFYERYLLFNNYKIAKVHNKALYCLDAKKGNLLWAWTFKPLFPKNKVLIWHGFGISPDGKYVAVLSQDGRGFLLYNPELIKTYGNCYPLWEKDISKPIIVDNLTIFGYGSVAKVTKKHVIFSTGNTHIRLGKKERLSIEHPTSNSLFVYDLKGNLLWTYRIGGLCYTIPVSKNSRYVVLASRGSRTEKDTSHHGVYLFDTLRLGGGSDKLVWFYHTEGICISVDISKDGKYIAALEYPIDMDIRDDFEDIHGKHMLYLLR